MDRKLIPFTKDFYVSTRGEVFDSNGVKRNTYVNGDGYITVTVKTLDGKWVTFGVHRLVAITHLTNKTPEQTEVNHRDGDITNNDMFNLEWVTASQNNIHSEIMRLVMDYHCLYASRNNIPFAKYLNAHEAAIDVGCLVLDVWDSVKNSSPINGVQFHFRQRSKALPLELCHDRSTNFRTDTRQPPKPVKMLNVDTGEILEFQSLLAAGKHFKVSASHVFQAIQRTSRPKLFLKKYQVQFTDVDFPTLTEEELKTAKTYGAKRVIAYNVTNRSVSIFKTATEFISYTELSKKAVTTSLKNNRLRLIGGWVALYLTPENMVTLKSYISGPAEI